jgi:hypothetical protein
MRRAGLLEPTQVVKRVLNDAESRVIETDADVEKVANEPTVGSWIRCLRWVWRDLKGSWAGSAGNAIGRANEVEKGKKPGKNVSSKEMKRIKPARGL